MISKDASLAAPMVCMIRDRVRHAGLRNEDVLSVPNEEQMF